MRPLLTASFVVLTLFSFGQLGATTWYIKADGTGDASSIYGGIISATAGDTIEIAAGTFYEHSLQWFDKPLVIRSESGPDVTTVDCQSLGSCFFYQNTLASPGYLEISGLTIANATTWSIYAASDEDDILIENNTLQSCYYGIGVGAFTSGSATVNNNRVLGCTGLGVNASGSTITTVTNNEVSGSAGDGIAVYADNFLIDGNLIADNTASGILATATDIEGTISNNTIHDNGDYGIECGSSAQKLTISYNVMLDNSYGIGGIVCNDTIDIVNNTIAGGAALYFGKFCSQPWISVSHNIISNSGYICTNPEIFEWACNDLYYYGYESVCGTDLGGNFSLDPVFCDLVAGDLGLTRYSPCLGGPCGQVGALGLGGCPDERPYIVGAEDVGNDQGGQLRLSWERSKYDDINSVTPVLNYGIYRRQDAYYMAQAEDPPEPQAVDGGSEPAMIAGWDYLTSVPARADSAYQTIVPTLCDSTLSLGDCWSVFFVSAATATPAVFWDSDPDSGYSVDNIVPTAPAFVINYNAPGGNQLSWSESEDPDAAYYNIYRTQNLSMTIGTPGPVHSTTGTSWTDPIADGWKYSYSMTTVDDSGNESPQSEPDITTGAGGPPLPDGYTLYQNEPNPFNPTTLIRYYVPGPGGVVKLAIYSVTGELVRTLVDGPVEAGMHAVEWNGRDGAGMRVASGVYFYRLSAPGYRSTRKGVLLE